MSDFCRPGFANGWVLGSRTDQTHLADQHIPELWEFIQFGVAQPFPKWCNSVIFLAGDARAAITFWGFIHGAELEHLEDDPISPDARAPVKYRPGRIPLDQNGDDSKERGKKDQPDQCGGEIKGAFYQPCQLILNSLIGRARII